MLILAIETATREVSCALGDENGEIASFSLRRDRRHVETLIPAVSFLLEQSQRSRTELTHIAVDVGPGLFTGLRVGVGTARALATALRVPMVAVASLDALAIERPAELSTDATTVSVLDAKRGEVFWKFHEGNCDIQLGSPLAFAEAIRAHKGDVIIAGETDLVVGSLPTHVRILPQRSPHASCVLQLATYAVHNDDVISPEQLSVSYLRKSDAELNRDTRSEQSHA